MSSEVTEFPESGIAIAALRMINSLDQNTTQDDVKHNE